jgi:DNA damage-binding protein 1
MRLAEHEKQILGSSILFCTVSGAIGVILPLTEEKFAFLNRLQYNLSKVIKGVGGFLHEE